MRGALIEIIINPNEATGFLSSVHDEIWMGLVAPWIIRPSTVVVSVCEDTDAEAHGLTPFSSKPQQPVLLLLLIYPRLRL